RDDGVAWVTLNRPEVLNAVNMAMRDELWEVFHALRDDPDVRVAVFRGAGDRAFSSGADISEFGTAPSYIEARRARRERDLWGFLLSIDKPLIAAVHGWALGAGCEMSLLCDLRIASEDARFGLPEVSLGYIPSAGGTQTLPRTIPPGVALGMILSGDPIDAREALRLGLVNRVVPKERLFEEADAWARTLAAKPPRSLRYIKEAVREGLSLPLAEGLALEMRLASLCLIGRDEEPA
ncbi:MAG TPA: enoyl-CoA hydratase/isomerase family protein, partial [Dehalococcoidia bacterium]|nr:enoyl-CoA hydratase/isomerase family protein [Dehalococcoidia bacterium]